MAIDHTAPTGLLTSSSLAAAAAAGLDALAQQYGIGPALLLFALAGSSASELMVAQERAADAIRPGFLLVLFRAAVSALIGLAAVPIAMDYWHLAATARLFVSAIAAFIAFPLLRALRASAPRLLNALLARGGQQ